MSIHEISPRAVTKYTCLQKPLKLVTVCKRFKYKVRASCSCLLHFVQMASEKWGNTKAKTLASAEAPSAYLAMSHIFTFMYCSGNNVACYTGKGVLHVLVEG